MNLTTLLTQPEGKTLEFKRDLSSPDGILRTMVAFANTAGGTILIGVEDKTHRVVGIGDPFVEEERLANLVATLIAPRLVPDISIVSWRKKTLLVVQIHPTRTAPFYLTRLGLDDGVFVRVGSTNRKADRQLIEELRRTARGESFDESPMPELTADAVDVRAVSALFAPVRTIRRADLRTLKVMTVYGGRDVPTVGGVLLFGVDRFDRFPDAYLKMGRFDGTTRSRILDMQESRAPFPQAIDDAVAFVEKHTMRAAVFDTTRRVDRWTIPPVALREAVVNAIVHADYSQIAGPIRLALYDDRLEIENPGLLPAGLTIDDLRHGMSKPRNRVIARIFSALGLIEQWGSGVRRMIEACTDVGLPEPLFEEIATHFRVTIRAATKNEVRDGRRRTSGTVDVRDREILDLLAARHALNAERGVSTRDVAQTLGVTTRTARTRLAALVDRGLVAELGTGPHDPHRSYVSTAAASGGRYEDR